MPTKNAHLRRFAGISRRHVACVCARMQRSRLVGRASDRERLERALRDDARVTLLGPPGVGKSALAKLLAVPRLLWVRAPRAPWRDLTSDVLIAAGLGGVEHHGAWPSVLRERARFDLLPPIHASATRKMQRWGLAIEANRLHTAHFVEVARRHAQDAAADWPALHADRDNLQTAFEAALRLRKQAQVAALARALDLLRVTAGEANAHRDLLERSVAALRDAGLPDERAAAAVPRALPCAARSTHARGGDVRGSQPARYEAGPTGLVARAFGVQLARLASLRRSRARAARRRGVPRRPPTRVHGGAEPRVAWFGAR